MSSKLSRQQVNQLSTKDTAISLLEGTLDRSTLELQNSNKGIQRKNRRIEALLFEISMLYDFISTSQQDSNWEQYETSIFKQQILKRGLIPCVICARRKATQESGFKYCYKCDPENVKNKAGR